MSKLVRLICYREDASTEPFELDIPRVILVGITKYLVRRGWTVEESVIP